MGLQHSELIKNLNEPSRMRFSQRAGNYALWTYFYIKEIVWGSFLNKFTKNLTFYSLVIMRKKIFPEK